jgi:hypothetical protein
MVLMALKAFLFLPTFIFSYSPASLLSARPSPKCLLLAVVFIWLSLARFWQTEWQNDHKVVQGSMLEGKVKNSRCERTSFYGICVA